MKTIKVAAAILCDSLTEIRSVYATARGYGAYRGWWEFPGGKIEPGETPEQALTREILEELDADITVGPLLKTVEYDYPEFHLSMACFLAQLQGSTPVLKEAAEARWLNRKELDSVNWLPADRLLLPELSRRMSK